MVCDNKIIWSNICFKNDTASKAVQQKEKISKLKDKYGKIMPIYEKRM